MSAAVRQCWLGAIAVVTWTGVAPAADINHGTWLFNFNERAQLSISVPVSNVGQTASGPIVIRFWATMDARSSEELTSGFLLIEERIEEGLAADQSVELSSPFRDPIEPPGPGQYNMALTIEEEAFDADPALLSFAAARLEFPLPEAPTEAEIRNRIAGMIPCGALFVPFSLASLVGLCVMKLVVRRRVR